MAVNYLGKRKLYEFLKAFCEGRDYIGFPKLSSVVYNRSHGTECIETDFAVSSDWYDFDLWCRNGSCMLLSVYKSFELESGECGKREIAFFSYRWINGEWVCVYKREK